MRMTTGKKENHDREEKWNKLSDEAVQLCHSLWLFLFLPSLVRGCWTLIKTVQSKECQSPPNKHTITGSLTMMVHARNHFAMLIVWTSCAAGMWLRMHRLAAAAEPEWLSSNLWSHFLSSPWMLLILESITWTLLSIAPILASSWETLCSRWPAWATWLGRSMALLCWLWRLDLLRFWRWLRSDHRLFVCFGVARLLLCSHVGTVGLGHGIGLSWCYDACIKEIARLSPLSLHLLRRLSLPPWSPN